jgi:hypothetical protein
MKREDNNNEEIGSSRSTENRLENHAAAEAGLDRCKKRKDLLKLAWSIEGLLDALSGNPRFDRVISARELLPRDYEFTANKEVRRIAEILERLHFTMEFAEEVELEMQQELKELHALLMKRACSEDLSDQHLSAGELAALAD